MKIADEVTARSDVDGASQGGASTPERAASHHLAELVQKWGLVGVLALVIAGFSISRPDTFATSDNFRDILTSQPPVVFIAFAAMVVLVSGHFDLSLGANLGFCQYLVLKLITDSGVSWVTAVAVTVGAGCAIGAFNAVVVAVLKINSFIATIGVSTVLIGILELMSGGNAPIFGGAPKGLTDLGQGEIFGISLPVLYALVAATLLWILLEYTVVGRELAATGSNPTAAVLSGLRARRSTVCAFVLAGFLCSIAGIIATARIGAADATSGPSYLLPAYAAAFLGATAIRPGFFNVWGTVIAIFLVAVGITGLQLNGVDSWVTPVFNGAILLVAVAVSNLAARRRQGQAALT